jgi:uncharacterized OB-fold protein
VVAAYRVVSGGLLSTYIAPELFASVQPLLLAGSRCQSCGSVEFPAGDYCASCANDTTVRIRLPDRGSVWTWTVQRFPPKPPYQVSSDDFVPFAVGYVDLGDILVESLLVGDIDRLEIGLPVRLVSHPITGPDGLCSFAFRAMTRADDDAERSDEEE